MDEDKVFSVLSKEVKNYKVPVVDFMKISGASPYRILVATILSARTKDEVTSEACKRLFYVADDFDSLSRLSEEKIRELIYPVGFYKTKAKHLKELPKFIESEFSGDIPKTIEELIKLPGVGRKTANLVLAVGFEIPAICVDTHVHRIFNRLGYLKTKTPLKTEMALRKKLPKRYWLSANRIFVAFGQHICRPIGPRCSVCPIYGYCKRVGVKTPHSKR